MQPVNARKPVSSNALRARAARAAAAAILLLGLGAIAGCGGERGPRTSAAPIEGQPGLKVYRHGIDRKSVV